jgi:hypothetical protein
MTREETKKEEFICYICGEDFGGPTDYCTCLRCMSCEELYDWDTAQTFVVGEDGEERCQKCHDEFVKN